MTHELNPDPRTQPSVQNQNPRIPLVRLGQGDFTRDFNDEHEEEKPDGFDATLYRLTRLGMPEDMATSMIARHGCDALNCGLDAPTEETLDNGSRWRVYRFFPLCSLRIRIDDPARPSPRVRVEPTQGYNPCGCDAPELLAEVEENLKALTAKTSFTLPAVPRVVTRLEAVAAVSALAGCAVWAYFGGMTALGGLVAGFVMAVAFLRLARHIRSTGAVA